MPTSKAKTQEKRKNREERDRTDALIRSDFAELKKRHYARRGPFTFTEEEMAAGERFYGSDASRKIAKRF